VAREFGIPAVVGTTNAGDRISTGDRIRVNGTTGVVELLG
jgi:phosphoenolpyruvate-protein kinase (PTS system EI component)